MKIILSHSKLESGAAKTGLYSHEVSSEGVYEHLAGVGWIGDIIRLKTWGWDGPHCVCTHCTPVTQVGYTTVFIDAD